MGGGEVPNPLIIDGSISIVPEPSSLALFGLVALALAGYAVRARALLARRKLPAGPALARPRPAQ